MTASELIELAARVEAGSENEPCYCGRWLPDDLCPCTRMARDMRLMERENRFRALAAQQQDRQTEGDAHG